MKEVTKKITDLLVQSHGINISMFDDSFLNKTLQKRITEKHPDSKEAYYSFLEKNNKEGKHLFDSLHISYSEFFRNNLTYAVLEHLILPELLFRKNNAKELRIWSTACAAGQEAYSLAMILEGINHGNKKINYRIFATDQDELQVDKANKGQYLTKELTKLNLNQLNTWFTQDGDHYLIKQRLKEKIDFSVFDLFSNDLICPPTSIFGNFDLVICANILFYYKSKYRKIILEKASNSLATNGYLITGEAEREILLQHDFQEVFPQSAIFKKYR